MHKDMRKEQVMELELLRTKTNLAQANIRLLSQEIEGLRRQMDASVEAIRDEHEEPGYELVHIDVEKGIVELKKRGEEESEQEDG